MLTNRPRLGEVMKPMNLWAANVKTKDPSTPAEPRWTARVPACAQDALFVWIGGIVNEVRVSLRLWSIAPSRESILSGGDSRPARSSAVEGSFVFTLASYRSSWPMTSIPF